MKILSYAFLGGSELKLISYWKANFVILFKSARSCLAVAFGSFINVNKEVSSAKSFGFDSRFSVRLIIKIKKSRGPSGPPALIKPLDEIFPFNKTRYFLLSRKLINNCNKLPQIPLRPN